MPPGNHTPNIEKIGMQFGSLSLGGDDLDGYVSYNPFSEHYLLRNP